MSDNELFREVDEAVRQDRALEFWKKWGSWLVSAAVAVVAAVAINVWWEGRSQSQRERDTTALMSALVAGGAGPAETLGALDGMAGQARAGAGLLARLNAAGLAAEAGDREGAATRYRAVAGDSSVDAVWRNFALVSAALLEMDTADPAALSAELAPLTADTSAWRFTARELTAYLALRQGEADRALGLFRALAEDGVAPAGVRSRARELADALSAP